MEYRLIHSARRTIGFTVRDGQLIVRAPYGTSQETVDRLVEAHASWIRRAMERQAQRPTTQDLSEEEIAVLRREARAYLTKKTAEYAAVMGVDYGRITITGAKTRFGSCSSQGNLSYSYRLMLYPEPAREYVVVHELAHRVHMNHSAAFYALVAAYMPDYKERKRLLR